MILNWVTILCCFFHVVNCKGVNDVEGSSNIDERRIVNRTQLLLTVGVDSFPKEITEQLDFVKSTLPHVNLFLANIWKEVEPYVPIDVFYLGNNWFSDGVDVWEEKIGINLIGNSQLFVMIEKFLSLGVTEISNFFEDTDLPLHISLDRNYTKLHCDDYKLEGCEYDRISSFVLTLNTKDESLCETLHGQWLIRSFFYLNKESILRNVFNCKRDECVMEFGGCLSSETTSSNIMISILSKNDVVPEKDVFTDLALLSYRLEELSWLPKNVFPFDTIRMKKVENVVDGEVRSGDYVFGNVEKPCRVWSYGANGICYGCPNFGITLTDGATNEDMCYNVLDWIEKLPQFAEILLGTLISEPCSFWEVVKKIPDTCKAVIGEDEVCEFVSEVVDDILGFKVSESIEICQDFPKICEFVDKLIANKEPCSFFESFKSYQIGDVEFPIPVGLYDEFDSALKELSGYISCDLDMVYYFVAESVDMAQRQMQYQAWLGIYDWDIYHYIIDEMMSIIKTATGVMKELDLICKFKEISVVKTELINTNANFRYISKPWEERVRENIGASVRNHFIKYGLEKYYHEHKDMLIEWDYNSQELLSHILEYVPMNVKHLGSSWFRNMFKDFTTMIQLDLFSSRSLNMYIEYFVTMVIEEYIKMGIYFANEAKWGLVTAFSLPEHCRTNFTVSLDTFYEPVCGEGDCFDSIRDFSIVLTNTNLCEKEEGQDLMNRIFVEYFYELFPSCETSYTCKLRWGSCSSKNDETNVFWSVVGDLSKAELNEPFIKMKLPKMLDSFDAEVSIKASTKLKTCDVGEFVYGGKCTSCPINTYGPVVGATICKDCPHESITYSRGTECQEKCEASEEHVGVLLFKPEVNACDVWKYLDLFYNYCRSKGSDDEFFEICKNYDVFYALAKISLINEYTLEEALTKELCQTGLCKFLQDVLQINDCADGNRRMVSNKIKIPVELPSEMIEFVLRFFSILKEKDLLYIINDLIDLDGVAVLLLELRTPVEMLIKGVDLVMDNGIAEKCVTYYDMLIQILYYSDAFFENMKISDINLYFDEGECEEEEEEEEECEAGEEWSSRHGKCVSCAKGRYSVAGKGCKRCPSGTYSNKAKAVECKACPEGTTSNAGSSSCEEQDNGDSSSDSEISILPSVDFLPTDASLTCMIRAGDQPTVDWSIDGQILSTDTKVTFETEKDFFVSEFSLPNIDEGEKKVTCSVAGTSRELEKKVIFFDKKITKSQVFTFKDEVVNIKCYHMDGYNYELLIGDKNVDNIPDETKEGIWIVKTHRIMDITKAETITCTSFLGSEKSLVAASTTVDILVWGMLDESRSFAFSATDEQVKVQCYVPSTIMSTTLSVFKNNEELPKTEPTTLNEVQDGGITYELVEVVVEGKGEGEYVCNCEALINDVKVAVTSMRNIATVTMVNILPRGIVTTDKVTVTCTIEIEGFDVDSVIWKKNDEELSNPEVGLNDDGAYTLTLDVPTEPVDVSCHVIGKDTGPMGSAATTLIPTELQGPGELTEYTGPGTTISCSYKSAAVISARWTGNFDNLEYDTVTEDEVGTDFKHHVITISSFDTFGLRDITCTLTNEEHAFERDFTTSLWRRGFIESPSEVYAMEGWDVSSNCKFATPFTPVMGKWKKGTINMDRTKFTLTNNKKGIYDLKLKPFKVTMDLDGTWYVCEFDDTKVSLQKYFRLDLVGLSILNGNTNIIVLSKENNKLECKVSGDYVEIDHVQWFDNSRNLIKSSEHTEVSHDQTERIVTLKYSSFHDIQGGMLQCSHTKNPEISASINVEIADVSLSTDSDIFVTKYADIKLTCTMYASNPDTSFVWTMDGISIARYQAYHTAKESQDNGVRRSVLTIHDYENAPFKSQASYKCGARVRSSKLIESNAITFNFILIKNKKEYNFVSPSWKIECRVKASKPPTTVRWLKGDTEVSVISEENTNENGLPYYIGHNTDFVYQLDLVQGTYEATAEYRCSFDFDGMPSITSDSISVSEHTATVTGGGGMIVQESGTSLKLECVVQTPGTVDDILWLGIDPTAAQEAVLTKTESGYKSVLTIDKLAFKHTANFYCEADTKIKLDDADQISSPIVDLVVADLNPKQVNVYGTKGERTELECLYDGNYIPTKVMWIRNGVTLSGDEYINMVDRRKDGAPGSLLRLIIKSAEIENSGDFSCAVAMGKNSEKIMNSEPIKLIISAITLGEETTKYHMQRENNPLILTCIFTSSIPASSTAWYLGAVPLTNSDKHSISLSDHVEGSMTSTLVVTSPDSTDTGEYVCDFDGVKPKDSYHVYMVSLEASVSVPGLTALDPVKLTCTMKYSEMCTLLWISKSGYDLNNKAKVMPADAPTGNNADGIIESSLTIALPNTPGHFDGNYACRVNCKGMNFESQDVNVIHERIYTDEDPQDSGRVLKRGCTYFGKEMPSGAAFHKDGSDNPIVSEGLWSITTSSDADAGSYTANLFKKEFSLDDSGSYTCTFTLAGRTVSTVTAAVSYAAITGMPSCLGVRHNKAEVILTCTYIAQVEPDQIKWLYRPFYSSFPTEVSEGISPSEFSDNKQSSYLSLGTAPKAGYYVCDVAVGEETKSKQTHIDSYDVVLSSSRDLQLQGGASLALFPNQIVNFACQATGLWFFIDWFNDDTFLQQRHAGVLKLTDQHLMIEYSSGNFGTIKCLSFQLVCSDLEPDVASNPYVLTSRDITFHVQPSSLIFTEDGNNLVLSCSVDNDEDMNIQWILDNNVFRSGETKAENDMLISTLEIKPKQHLSIKCKAFISPKSPVFSEVATVIQIIIVENPVNAFAVDDPGSWVSFTCKVRAPHVMEVALIHEDNVIGETKVTSEIQDDEKITIAITKVANLQNSFGGKFLCRIRVDNGYAYTEHATLVQAKFVYEPVHFWIINTNYPVEFHVQATALKPMLSWEKSEDGGETWNAISDNINTEFYPSDNTVYSILSILDLQNLDIKYRAVLNLGEQSGNSNSHLYTAGVQVKEIRITEINHDEILGLTPNSRIALWCRVHTFKRPAKIYIKYQGSSNWITTITSTSNRDEYVGTLANVRLGNIESGAVVCTAVTAYYLPVVTSSIDIEVAFRCPEDLRVDGGTVTYYDDTDGERYAKLTCNKGFGRSKSNPDVIRCKTRTGQWTDKLDRCLKVTPITNLLVLITWGYLPSHRFCTTDSEKALVVGIINKVGDAQCGFRSPNIGIQCLSDGTCEFKEGETTCTSLSTGFRVSVFIKLNLEGSSTTLNDIISDMRSRLKRLTLWCASNRKRDISDILGMDYPVINITYEEEIWNSEEVSLQHNQLVSN